jgi:zinc/manganese transport system substrate-binding protein
MTPIDRVATWGRRGSSFLAALAVVLVCAACGSPSGTGGKVAVVAAENFWGSIATQLGGDRVQVQSIITNPNTDPHTYEPTPADGRALAGAQYVIINGAGYDPRLQKLVDSSPASGRSELDISKLLGVKEGGNPHMWYSPSYVGKVIDQVTADLKRLDPADASYFDGQRSTYLSQGLKQYDDLRAQIKQKYAGTPVGSTESIFVYLANDLGLKVITPAEYMSAISEGNDPTAADKATFDQQITDRQMKVLVFNRQNSTPDVQTLVDKAKATGIPIASITETLDPANLTFQQWQSKQLQALSDALASAH